jgi:signal transduction histidine kinase
VRAARQQADVIRGGGLRFMSTLLAARDQSQKRDRDLVRELNMRLAEYSMLHEISRLVASPFKLEELYERTLALAGRLSQIAVGAICTYQADRERFVVSARSGLSIDFEERTQLSLSEPLIDELLTFRRPLPIGDVRERYRSTLMASAAREGMVSMLCLPVIVNEKVTAVIVLGTRERHEFQQEEIAVLTTLAAQVAMAIENQQLHEASRHKQALIEQLLAKVIAAQEDERKRLAAEIHDSVAQQLAGMLAQIQISQALLGAGQLAEVAEQLARLRQIVGDSVKEVRQIIFNLRPTSLDDLGLIPSIENYVKRYERDGDTRVMLETRQRQRLPPALETTVFRLVQESLTNIKKHARARSVRIRLHIDAHQVSLAITDDGIGFSWSQMTDKFLRGDAHGVEGMKERTALLGGTFRIDSEEGKGTTVRVDIPLPRDGPGSAVARPAAESFVTRSVGSAELAAVSETLTRLGEQALLSEATQATSVISRPRTRTRRKKADEV